MIKTFCDVCGKEIDSRDELYSLSITPNPNSPCFGKVPVTYMDLCLGCAFDMHRAFSKKKEKLNDGV